VLVLVSVLAVLCGTPVRAQSVTVTGLVRLVNRQGANARKPDNSNAVVWLTPAVDSSIRDHEVQSHPQPLRFRLLQRHKRFEPHVLAIPVGSVVDFPNLDPFFHNVFSLFEGKRFDLGLYEAGTTHSVKFDRAGVCYIFCNIHPEMSAVVVVLKTSYYAISDRAGEIAISSVPPGRYFMSVWHERCSPDALKGFPREITISAKEPSLGTISLHASSDLLATHKNKYGRDYDRPTPPSLLYERP
jgi:plastocyanin